MFSYGDVQQIYFVVCFVSREKDSFGLMPLRSVRTECMSAMIWPFVMSLSTYLKYPRICCLLRIFNKLLDS